MVVLLTSLAFVLFTLAFIADISDVERFGDLAAFVLILAAVAFGVLLFVAANSAEEGETPDAFDFGTIEATGEVTGGPALAFCPACGLEAPSGSRFCGQCGANLAESGPSDASDDHTEDLQPT